MPILNNFNMIEKSASNVSGKKTTYLMFLMVYRGLKGAGGSGGEKIPPMRRDIA
jgi:hypothetical protein